MPSTTDELIERVAAATGPDRQLDADIWHATGGRIEPGIPIGLDWFLPDNSDPVRDELTNLTGSLDAAIALVERVLDDLHIATCLRLALAECDVRGVSYDSNLARFVCLALLLALKHKEGDGDAD